MYDSSFRPSFSLFCFISSIIRLYFERSTSTHYPKNHITTRFHQILTRNMNHGMGEVVQLTLTHLIPVVILLQHHLIKGSHFLFKLRKRNQL